MLDNLEFFTGKKRSGKDFCLEGLIDDSRGKQVICRLSFSDELRVIANTIYPWLPRDIPDHLKDVPWEHPQNYRRMTPRQIWLHLGGDDGLRFVEPDLFLESFKRNQLPKVVANPDVLYIVTDVRTPQEYMWVKETGRTLTRITREDRSGIMEDTIEDFIDRMEVDFEFFNPFTGTQPFIDFYRSRAL
ncbi:hypothetical protein HWB92_gp155 [Serratia phage vB_SmaA_3M]|uniref:Deoxynucleotide monophosphate kinase n=1 Tax=Serratia phage vB_SmaA_3M TaxID=2419930 RepID=A0A3G2YSB6_9CAUD|nr:hypothetical protein HWB92_gp155 [Serratia phage vB_SmaA_3M]AYP28413.1 hypothetical protein 3M_157 [Serratia phage vB_SmaA_3M]